MGISRFVMHGNSKVIFCEKLEIELVEERSVVKERKKDSPVPKLVLDLQLMAVVFSLYIDWRP